VEDDQLGGLGLYLRVLGNINGTKR
jgi:hypothetical protein